MQCGFDLMHIVLKKSYALAYVELFVDLLEMSHGYARERLNFILNLLRQARLRPLDLLLKPCFNRLKSLIKTTVLIFEFFS